MSISSSHYRMKSHFVQLYRSLWSTLKNEKMYWNIGMYLSNNGAIVHVNFFGVNFPITFSWYGRLYCLWWGMISLQTAVDRNSLSESEYGYLRIYVDGYNFSLTSTWPPCCLNRAAISLYLSLSASASGCNKHSTCREWTNTKYKYTSLGRKKDILMSLKAPKWHMRPKERLHQQPYYTKQYNRNRMEK